MICEIFKRYINTIFPKVCCVCGLGTENSQILICDDCLALLPETQNCYIPENTLKLRLSHFAKIDSAAAFIYYNPNSDYSSIIHDIKFRNQRKLAFELGRLFAFHLQSSPLFKDIDLIIPVPLHKSRERWRGYNQSEYIANGISSVLGVEVANDVIIRSKRGKVQSKIKNRTGRMKNMEDAFQVVSPKELRNKTVLLVDDIITFGATVGYCAKEINSRVKSCTVKVAVLGETEKK